LLVGKCRTPVAIFCCDQVEGLGIESHTDAPVALVAEAAESDEGPITDDMLAGADHVRVAGSKFYVPVERCEAAQQIADHFGDLPDPVEPFERIREAIKEAHSQLARQRQDAA